MIRKIILFFLLAIVVKYAKADTVDTWHLYYNDRLIGAVPTIDSVTTITLRLDSIKPGDVLTVKYNSGKPCIKCLISLTTTGSRNHVVELAKEKGKLNSLSFELKKLVYLQRYLHRANFEIAFRRRNTPDDALHEEKTILFVVDFAERELKAP